MAKAHVEMRALNDAGDVANCVAFPAIHLHHADLRMQRGKGVGGNLRLGVGDGVEQRAFPGVRVTDQTNVRHQPQLKMIVAFTAWFAGLGVAGCLVGGGSKVMVALATPAAGAKDELLPVLSEVGHQLGILAHGQCRRSFRFLSFLLFGRGIKIDHHRLFALGVLHQLGIRLRQFLCRSGQFPNHGTAGNLDDEIFAAAAAFLLALAVVAVFGDKAGHVKLGDQVVQVVAGLKDDAAAAAAIAAIGAALGHKGFPAKGHTTAAAVPGAGVHFHLINEHGGIITWPTKKARHETSPGKLG